MRQVTEKYRGIKNPPHGGAVSSSVLTDFSISVNPFPLPGSVIKAYREAFNNISAYPDNENTELTTAFADVYERSAEHLLMTNGSAEAFSLIASALLEPGKKAMICEPCYSDYEHLSLLAGAEVVKLKAEESAGYVLEPDAVAVAAAEQKPDLIWLCSPNNPTGSVLPGRLIDSLCDQTEARGGYIVLDEAYAAFHADGYPAYYSGGFEGGKNLITVRSMTKEFGIPGLRLGSIIAEPEIIRILKLFKPCWSVSRPAEAVGKAVLGEIEYFRECWRRARGLQHGLVRDLVAAGLSSSTAAGNECGIFIFFKSPDLGKGKLYQEELENMGIRIRDCASMGAPGFCRAGVRLEEDNKKLVAATERLFKEYGAGNE